MILCWDVVYWLGDLDYNSLHVAIGHYWSVTWLIRLVVLAVLLVDSTPLVYRTCYFTRQKNTYKSAEPPHPITKRCNNYRRSNINVKANKCKPYCQRVNGYLIFVLCIYSTCNSKRKGKSGNNNTAYSTKKRYHQKHFGTKWEWHGSTCGHFWPGGALLLCVGGTSEHDRVLIKGVLT